MPAPQTEQENCVAHNGSLIPVPGRDIMVQAWYQGGLSVFDFTDSAHPVEIAYFDRGPLDAKQAGHRRLLVHLLVQRQHLRLRDRARPRRLQAEAERVSVAERDRRGHPRPLDRVQRAAAAEGRLAGELRRRPGVSRSARPQQEHRRRARARRSRRRSTRPTSFRSEQGQRRGGNAGSADVARGPGREGRVRRDRPRRDAAQGAGRDDQRTGGAA